MEAIYVTPLVKHKQGMRLIASSRKEQGHHALQATGYGEFTAGVLFAENLPAKSCLV